MSAIVKTFPSAQDVETVFVGGSGGTNGAVKELARVVVTTDVATIDHELVTAGSPGTIVAVWSAGDFVDVDFDSAHAPATVAIGSIRLS